MMELTLILEVILMFLVRIGLPVLMLVTLGVIVERWQAQRDGYLKVRNEIRMDEPIKDAI